MDYRRRLAHQCEAELQEIRRLWQSSEYDGIEEWSTESTALDHWRHSPDRHILDLVIAFREQFSFIRCLQKECRRLDGLLLEIEHTTDLGQPPENPKSGTAASTIDDYDFSYFTRHPHSWAVKFAEWENSKAISTGRGKDWYREILVTKETAHFALPNCLHQALDDAADLWKEWGAASLAIQDGILARENALDSLRNHLVEANFHEEGYFDLRPPPVIMKDLRKEIRSRLTPKPENEAEGLRKRKAKLKKTIIPSSGSADQRNPGEAQLTVTEQDLSTLPDPSSSTGESRLTFTFLTSRVSLLCAKTREIQWRFWSSGVRKW